MTVDLVDGVRDAHANVNEEAVHKLVDQAGNDEVEAVAEARPVLLVQVRVPELVEEEQREDDECDVEVVAHQAAYLRAIFEVVGRLFGVKVTNLELNQRLEKLGANQHSIVRRLVLNIERIAHKDRCLHQHYAH